MAGHEFELRFAADEASFAKLRRSTALKARTVGPVRTRRLIATYHDTPDDRLFAAGIAWQIKRQGRSFLQTVKPINGAGIIRTEAEAPIKSARPDPEAVLDAGISHALKHVLGGKVVVPRVEMDVRRTERRLVTERGDIVELSLDTSDVTAGESTDRAFEVDLALKAGTPASLIEIARPLAEDLPLELSLLSGAERGFYLREGKPPGKAPWIKLPAEASAAEALSVIVTSTVRHIALHAREARRTERSEAVHQIRVGLRRLRAVLSDYGHAFDAPDLTVLAHRARDLATILSPARDLDVFLSDVLKPARDHVTYPEALGQITEMTRLRRAEAWTTARAALEAPGYRVFLVDIAAIALCGFGGARDATQPAALPARRLAAEVLDRRLGKARAFGERLSELATEERHELRKELKKLRYPAEFFASLFDSKGTRKFLGCLTELQDDLGGLNDVATARDLLQEFVESAASQNDTEVTHLALTAGEIIGWHSYRAEKSLKRLAKHWDEFEDTPAFWRKG